MTTTFESNGRTPTPGPLAQAAAAEAHLIEQLDAIAAQIDRLATDAVTAAKERLSRSLANLTDRLKRAEGCARDVVRLATIELDAYAGLLADLARMDVTPAPLTQEQAGALREAIGKWPGDETDEEIRSAMKDDGDAEWSKESYEHVDRSPLTASQAEAVAQAPQREPWPSPEQVTAALDDAGFAGHDEPDGEALENLGRQVAHRVAKEDNPTREEEEKMLAIADEDSEVITREELDGLRGGADQARPRTRSTKDCLDSMHKDAPGFSTSPARTPRKRKGRQK